MSPTAALFLLGFISVYLGTGSAFGLAFVALGVGRIDSSAIGAPWGFRLVILPAAILLWPLLAFRWFRGIRQPPDECTAHLKASRRDRG